MTSLREWLTPTRTLLLLLFLLTLASVSTITFFAWRLLQQQRMVEAQRSRERLEQAADRIAAIVRGSLAESGERLGAGTLSLNDKTAGDLLFDLSPTSLAVTPPGQLLYYPAPPPDPELDPKLFAEAELFEFSESQPEEALRAYAQLANSPNVSVRAGALLRMARVLRNLGRNAESIAVYRKLEDLDANVAGAPAALVAAQAVCELSGNPQQAFELKTALGAGRWRLTRGQFEYYWSAAGRMSRNLDAPPAGKRRLTEIAEFVWNEFIGNDRLNHPDARGQEIAWIGGAPIFLIWRGTPGQRRVLVTRPESFLKPDGDVRFAFVDAEGRTLAGQKDSAVHGVVRTAAESGLPWTLYVSDARPSLESGLIARRFLLAGLSVMMLFLVLGTYFIARAIRREAEVRRMQSHFVSTVSHEFRSPLTSMRQLSEMLALGRVPSEERRQMYYETLVKETTRLQRLIEALLNFGRMEAGARQYQFQELDALAVVERVVGEFGPQVASTGKHIETETTGPCWIEADAEAISVALRNLLDNAVKYSPDRPTVWVGCEVQREKVAIRVRDQGLGIAESERRTIFRKFMRGSAAEAANVKGSGVGLAMVSHIVAAHGGEVLVASELGRGSTFTMLFPATEKTCQKS